MINSWATKISDWPASFNLILCIAKTWKFLSFYGGRWGGIFWWFCYITLVSISGGQNSNLLARFWKVAWREYSLISERCLEVWKMMVFSCLHHACGIKTRILWLVKQSPDVYSEFPITREAKGRCFRKRKMSLSENGGGGKRRRKGEICKTVTDKERWGKEKRVYKVTLLCSLSLPYRDKLKLCVQGLWTHY